MNIFARLRRLRDEAATRRAMRHLDNHLLRDIGMPERRSQDDYPRS
ncbi:MAG: DUF1127 domain-containing protein [Pseudomonadota bacterium]